MKSMARWLPLFVLFAALTSACGGKNDDGPVCGNDACEAGEDATSCAADCAASCGNGTCDSGETTANCSADCPAATCNNNGTCNTGETNTSCPADCPTTTCGNGTCEAGETNANCSADCPVASCGNGTCDAGENATTCAVDCATTCNNNGTCDAGETNVNCPADCTVDVCSLVAGALNVGTDCSTQTEGFCGTGVCASFDASTPATCFQGCVPSQCETTCTGQERCLGVTDQNGNAIEIEPGVLQGVCDIPATGNQTAFDQCGGTVGACEAAMDCLAFSQTQPAMCMPQCTADADCPTREGIVSRCVITTSPGANPSNCGLLCDPADDPRPAPPP